MAKVYVRRTGDVAELVISAPPLNLFDGELATDLESALDEVAALIREGAARAVLLRAEGTVFCAGVDVHEFQGLGSSRGAVLMARVQNPVHGFGILIKAMGRHLVLSGYVLKRFGWLASEHELPGDL